MKHVLAMTLLLAGLLPQPDAEASKRIALVIGNANYPSSPLRNPVNDASDIAAALESAKFEVTLLTDAGRSEIREAIRDFHRLLPKAETGLFYYAGHGIQYQGDNYLIPVDAELAEEFEIPDETVSAYAVLRAMEAADNPLNVVILDACRNNPFARRYRSQSRGLARMSAPSGSLIAYATAPGDIAIDGDGRNGVYTKHLLKAIQTPGLSLEEVFKQVRINVVEETGGQQTPWEESSLTGDFFFQTAKMIADITYDAMQSMNSSIGPTADNQEALPASAAAPNDRLSELEVWNGIKDSTFADDYRLFISMFPDGAFAPFASRRLEQIEASSIQPQAFASAAPTSAFSNDEAESDERPGSDITVPAANPDWINAALAQCDEHLSANRLTTGEGGTALECYREVLHRAPGHPDALAGMATIKDRYLSWTRSAIDKNEPERARRYLQGLGIVDAEHPMIEPLLAEADALFAVGGTGDTPAISGVAGTAGEKIVRIGQITTEGGNIVPALARTYALEGYPKEAGIHVTDRGVKNYDVIINGRVLAQTNRVTNNYGGVIGKTIAGVAAGLVTGGLYSGAAYGYRSSAVDAGLASGISAGAAEIQPADTIRTLEAVVELRALNRENGREIVETAKGRRTAPVDSDPETIKAAQLYALGSAIKIAAGNLGAKINATWLGDAAQGGGNPAKKAENHLNTLVEKLKNIGIVGEGGGESYQPPHQRQRDK